MTGGEAYPHRKRNPRWCGVHLQRRTYRKARWIWRVPGKRDIFVCTPCVEELKNG